MAQRSDVSFSDGQKAARRLLEGSHRYVCLAGGARSGKTFLIVRAIVERATNAPESRHAMFRLHTNHAHRALVNDTLPVVMDRCFHGMKWKEYRQDGFVAFNNGARLTIGGLDDRERVDKILGLEFVTVFLNEASQIPYESALVAFTRLAQVVPDMPQRAYVDLNPTAKSHWTNVLFGEKREPTSKQPLSHPDTYARAFLNPVDNAENLSPDFLAGLAALPERQRKRFYEGVYVETLDDALWSLEIIDAHRRAPDALPSDERRNVVVAVDPSGAASPDDARDEIGIVVAARGTDGDAYVLADLSCRESAPVWARRAVTAYHEYAADRIVAEGNFGGDMVRATIQAADPNVPVHLVTASRGKAVRAEPIAMRYALGQVHHLGRFAKLEDQLCAFSGAGYGGQGSPDHADAAVWALTYLFGRDEGAGMVDFYRILAESQGMQPG